MFVIFDLDGTLADITHRLHFIQCEKPDWDAFNASCLDDEPKWPVIEVLEALGRASRPYHRIQVWSGRMDTVRAQTELWLETHGCSDFFEKLRMRPEGDFTPDYELKERWLKSEPYPPDIVFDDRQTVVDMWRRNGITCCQVEQWKESR